MAGNVNKKLWYLKKSWKINSKPNGINRYFVFVDFKDIKLNDERQTDSYKITHDTCLTL